jgi:LysM domain
MFRYIIALLMICCLTAYAANDSDELELQANHPEQHVVVKGDTLWGISAQFLKNPWAWPKVWKMNRSQIKNPHLIYPGDVIALDMSSGKPELRLLRESVTLQPGIREEPLAKQAIPTITPSIIAPFLSQPLVIESDSFKNSPVILSGPDNRVILGAGTKIYLDKIEQGQALSWYIYRAGKTLVDPDTKEELGTEAIFLGNARVTKYGVPATAEITNSKEEIFAKDLLIAAPDTIESSYVPHAPDNKVSGKIVSIYGGVAETGKNSIVTINRGSKDGLEVGHVLAIARQGNYVKNPNAPEAKSWWDKFKADNKTDPHKKVIDYGKKGDDVKLEEYATDPNYIKLPNERVGLLMIFRVFNKVSYGLVMQSAEPIHISDVVETP